MRIILAALLLTGCQQYDETPQLNRIENKVDRLSAKQQLPAPMTKEQYEQMPEGTLFLAPDGTTRRKVKTPAR